MSILHNLKPSIFPLDAKHNCRTSLLCGCCEDSLGQLSVQHLMHIPQCLAHTLSEYLIFGRRKKKHYVGQTEEWKTEKRREGV